ncbi:hypothetical protein [Kibdelosporangium phytohabitans]|nr:hypothetical protein [Kibdelosporangium phytohabitans]MBE1467509.1 hypothetical protein [Kibdelosporangium phytohabitans]
MAVLLRLSGNAGSTAKLTSELADEFAELGWCTPEEYVSTTHDLISGGLADEVPLRVNPLLHTDSDCQRCAAHQQLYEQARREYDRAMARWTAGVSAYPYAPSTATLHLRDCVHTAGAPAAIEPTLRKFAHSHDYPEDRLVLGGDDDAEPEREEDYPGSQWWDRPYGPAPDYGLRALSSGTCLSVREARAWSTTANGRPRNARRCKTCRPIDPFLLDTADTTVLYRAKTHPVELITVEADDGEGVILVQQLAAPPGSAFGWGSASADDRYRTAVHVLTNATLARATESATLPYAEFASTFPGMTSDSALSISRTEVRAWLRDWYDDHPTHPAPAALAVLLDHDLAFRPDPGRLSTSMGLS